MADLTTSSAVDALMQAADEAGMQTAMGLGTAAAADSSDFATAAQGALADSAVQPADLGDSASKDTGTTAGTVAAGDDSRFSDARTPTTHAASHTNGTDNIQDATASQKGLATAAQITKLDGITGTNTGDQTITLTGDVTGSGTGTFAATIASNAVTEAKMSITDVTTGNASTSAHGFAPKATAPSSGLRSVLGIDNGETGRTDKALFDATTPTALGTAAAVGTAMTAARRDHVHQLPWRESLALSDLTTALTASGSVVVGTYTFMESRTLSAINLAILTAPTGAALEVETKKNGTTIWTTKPTIDAGEYSTLTAATPGVLATTSFAAGDILTFYITQIGSTIAGAGLQAYMKGVF